MNTKDIYENLEYCVAKYKTDPQVADLIRSVVYDNQTETGKTKLDTVEELCHRFYADGKATRKDLQKKLDFMHALCARIAGVLEETGRPQSAQMLREVLAELAE